MGCGPLHRIFWEYFNYILALVGEHRQCPDVLQFYLWHSVGCFRYLFLVVVVICGIPLVNDNLKMHGTGLSGLRKFFLVLCS